MHVLEQILKQSEMELDWLPIEISRQYSEDGSWVNSVSSVNNCTVLPFQKCHLLDNNLEMWQ